MSLKFSKSDWNFKNFIYASTFLPKLSENWRWYFHFRQWNKGYFRDLGRWEPPNNREWLCLEFKVIRSAQRSLYHVMFLCFSNSFAILFTSAMLQPTLENQKTSSLATYTEIILIFATSYCIMISAADYKLKHRFAQARNIDCASKYGCLCDIIATENLHLCRFYFAKLVTINLSYVPH